MGWEKYWEGEKNSQLLTMIVLNIYFTLCISLIYIKSMIDACLY